ncbi:MAG: DUF4783 domain-containing protein [Candidatus Latescibacteria bacterium]|nr:DUF4783 domain-containing protein [Candidatus Latescibacterota bacterium]NIM22611.1 DUF4783 domain-containing protein [Candidatus Latescibacterota bacterium]NIO01415.1 DUF4783 domain-containing protein [Candidatus Latescibacterota bacterium]NIO27925.1 DUF4783 domain-containing protein [Candidatus Latescibacterota bacterium]NIO55476.1 DUF4783 domain-containing protein [Candidatus Latescibacterota bacterium]
MYPHTAFSCPALNPAFGSIKYQLSGQQKPQRKKQPVKSEKLDSTEVKTVEPAEKLPNESSGPLASFADIEVGWKKENVKKVLRHFGKGKVAIAIGGIGPSGGRFSKSQSYYLLTDLFKYTITKKFEFVQYRNMDSGKRKVFAVAEWYYKRTDDGRLFKDKIYVSLHQEGNHWVIDEIKSIR